MRFAPFFKLLLAALAVSVALVAPAPVSAQAGDIGNPLTLCVARAVAGQQARMVFAGKVPLDCKSRQTDFGGGDFWVLSSSFSKRGEVALRSGSLWQDRRIVYALYADGVILKRVSDGLAASRNLQLGAIFLDQLPSRPAPLVRVLWRIEGSANLRGIVNGARIATMRESGWSNLKMAAMYAAFAGLCLALLVHNLALWGALRHRFQLAYCLMVATLLVYALSSSGTLAWLFPDIANNDRMRINYLGLGMAAASALGFARSFFEERVFSGAIGRFGTALMVLLVATSAGFALLAPWHIAILDKCYTASFLAMMMFVPVLLVRAWQKHSNYLWLFALAWGAPVVFAGLRIANNLNLTGWSFWVDNSTILSMTAEALLSSCAIAYRIRLLSIERDLARSEELVARALADTDPLTGLLNRRAFLDRAIGREGEQALHVLDLDHFKAVNETIGHDGGDEVLRVVARVLRASVPSDALVARIGGEEFALVVAADRPLDPGSVLERLRAERMPFDLAVTASIGSCTGPLGSEIDWKKLYRRADRALYDAKAEGRDRVRRSEQLAA